MKNWLFIIILLCSLSGYSSKLIAHTPPVSEQTSPDEMLNGITKKHPVTYIHLASALFRQGQKDEAVVWYYVGQMRYRAHLMANPNLDPSGDPALYSSLKYVVGTPINEYAGSNVDNWVKLIEQAIAWNSANENSFTPKNQFSDIYKKVQGNFVEFKNYVSKNKDEIIKQRRDNGLDGS